MMAKNQLSVRLNAIRYEAEGINSYELVDPTGASLPPFCAGAHIDVQINDQTIRQYSLCNDPAERYRYIVAVLREETGRGGSITMHDKIRVGDQLQVSFPRNHFTLSDEAEHHLMIAGGIGITPMMAMITELERQKKNFTLHYCTRSPVKTAFLDRLRPLIALGKVVLHYDYGNPEKWLRFSEVLKDSSLGIHLYYCGPVGFMDAVQAASADWPSDNVHYESFAAPSKKLASSEEVAFQIKLSSTGETFEVSSDKSIVEVLRDHGYSVDTSCGEGYCGTCMTRYIEGEPEHRDTVLDAEDQREYVLICCARSKSHCLVLDL